MNEKLILTIINKFSSGSIGELELSDGTSSLTLRKERAGAAAETVQAAGGTAHDGTVRLGIAANASAGAAPGTPAGGEKITSPIVATFYAAPGPDAPPFVKPGSKIKMGQTLCILEAMKMMNHLEAEFNCEIIEVLAESGELVEYGQPLFTIKRL